MRNYKRNKKIFILLAALLLACIPGVMFYSTRSAGPTFVAAGAGLLTGGMIGLLFLNEQAYYRELIIKLSDLVATIAELRDERIFPENEDTLLSKLQDQVIKLTGILKAQKNKTAVEKAEIETLISDLSHQLKTPMATLTVYGELLENDALSAKERAEYTGALNTCISKLGFLIDSLIKMSRLESGLIRLNQKKNGIQDTLLTAVKGIMGKAKKKNITITYHSDRDIPILHDKNWTAEAFFNLLENAVKYTPQGGIITIDVIPYEMFLRIDIKDNGIGILPEEQTKIFARFYRGGNIDQEEGLGIGLYLSRKIITEQGGYIKLISNRKGSLFSVFLPL